MKRLILIILIATLTASLLSGISIQAATGKYTANEQCEHQPETSSCIEPTCTEEGCFGAVYCRLCGEKLAEGQIIPALGHDWDEGYPIPAAVADMCSYDLPHTWIYTCKRCGEICLEEKAATGCPSAGYTDAGGIDLWYHNAVDYVILHGYMQSTKDGQLVFAPEQEVSRAMVAEILYRIEGCPEVEYKAMFSDVADCKWYTDGIEWCAQNFLAAGKGNGRFDPKGKVTRQELAEFLRNLAMYNGFGGGSFSALEKFKDYEAVSGWAVPAVSWAISGGLMSGKQLSGEFYIAPKDTATRAELASLIMLFCYLYKSVDMPENTP